MIYSGLDEECNPRVVDLVELLELGRCYSLFGMATSFFVVCSHGIVVALTTRNAVSGQLLPNRGLIQEPILQVMKVQRVRNKMCG
jgi:hypothetical protein